MRLPDPGAPVDLAMKSFNSICTPISARYGL
jgi:hypothetical protein